MTATLTPPGVCCPLCRAEKLVALYCISAQSNRVGLFNFSPALAAEDLEMPAGAFPKGSP